ncbi:MULTISPECIES: VOC family protein [unclassified Anaeromyxobacter]|uniref:VOC family protein n=2 Tax=Anaeromyxobacter TaxID=161492 RepID=UPI001F59B7A0|nr:MULTISPECIES: VOC family protein [unclassified Anaeromyxobacter]
MMSAINWFELPVEDLERARRFYETVLATPLGGGARVNDGGLPMAFFPSSDGVGGALVKDPRFRPASDGAVVYLNADGVLDACVRRVEAAGGKVLVPKTDIGEHGHFALLLDTEGNRVGLHDRTRRAPERA